MQQPASNQPSPPFSDFAGLLATLTSPPPDTTESAPLWNSSDLGEDVTTLSYEHALRARARYRSENRHLSRGDRLLSPANDLDMDAAADEAIKFCAAGDRVAAAAPTQQFSAAPERALRSASVTIRMSSAECARLHERAVEAGLTVSAYLRSCALEAETLRAQVKQALAELKAGNEGTKENGSMGAREQGSKKPWRRYFLGWIGWLTRRGR